MENDSGLRALLVAEGSGGHVIPALQVARALSSAGAHVKVWYAQRQHTRSLVQALTQEWTGARTDIETIPIESGASSLERLWHSGQLWNRAQRCFDTFAPDVVVGFGGWVSAPVILAARARRIGCLLHEQNVVMGRANQWLTRWVDRVAVSFRDTQTAVHGAPSVMTGLPVRGRIGRSSRAQAASRFGLRPDQPTVFILGGSQGSRAINRMMMEVVALCSPEERRRWQIVHLVGSEDAVAVNAAYAAHHVASWVSPFLLDMETAYAQADLVIARAGASTIAELARCGTPSILIPYPHAGGHQRANAQLVETIGGGLMIEESEATAERLVAAIRRILVDERFRRIMGSQMRSLDCPEAADRLREAIVEVATARARRPIQLTPAVSGATS